VNKTLRLRKEGRFWWSGPGLLFPRFQLTCESLGQLEHLLWGNSNPRNDARRKHSTRFATIVYLLHRRATKRREVEHKNILSVPNARKVSEATRLIFCRQVKLKRRRHLLVG